MIVETVERGGHLAGCVEKEMFKKLMFIPSGKMAGEISLLGRTY